MEFNIGDRVITRFGAGVIVQKKVSYQPYLVVHDKPYPGLHDDGSLNFKRGTCWWATPTELRKEVQDGV